MVSTAQSIRTDASATETASSAIAPQRHHKRDRITRFYITAEEAVGAPHPIALTYLCFAADGTPFIADVLTSSGVRKEGRRAIREQFPETDLVITDASEYDPSTPF